MDCRKGWSVEKSIGWRGRPGSVTMVVVVAGVSE